MSLAAAMAIWGTPFCSVMALTARVDEDVVAAISAMALSCCSSWLAAVTASFGSLLSSSTTILSGLPRIPPLELMRSCSRVRVSRSSAPRAEPAPVADTIAPMTMGSPVGAAMVVPVAPAAVVAVPPAAAVVVVVPPPHAATSSAIATRATTSKVILMPGIVLAPLFFLVRFIPAPPLGTP